jgi:hypothetical protein
VPWVALDEQFPEHDKVMDLTDRAFRLHVTALCYCARNLTNGFLEPKHVKVVCAVVQVARPARFIDELVAADLWIVTDEGYAIKNYLDYNPTKDHVDKKRAEARERMKRLRSERTSGERSQEHDANVSANVREKFADALPSPTLGLSLAPSPSRDAAHGREKKPPVDRLVAACGGGPEVVMKLERTIRRWRSPVGDLEYAIDCATGPGVRDPLSVVLAELKKRGQDRSAA